MARRRLLLGCCLACCAVAGCTVGPDYKTPDTAVPGFFTDAAAAIKSALSGPQTPTMARARSQKRNTAPVDVDAWWRSLGDPELDSLVDRAVKGNLDLAVALDRLQAARTEEVAIFGDELPVASVQAAAAKGSGSDVTKGRVSSVLTSGTNTAGFRQINAIGGFEAEWELDIFGQYRRALEAARYDTQAALAARNAVLVAVVGDVVRAYVDLRGLQTRLAILRQDVDIDTRTLDVVQERYNRGLTNELDLTLAQRELNSLKATVAPLAGQVEAAQYVIAVFIGQMPGTLSSELDKPALIPALPQAIQPGLPLDLLRRRPDIKEAERELAASTARIGVATANLFPHLALFGSEGAQLQRFGVNPADGLHIWSVGPSFYWPLLDFGTLDAEVDIADLRTRARLESYRQTVLHAVSEVDSDIADYTAQQQRLANLSDAVTAAENAVTLAQQRYDRGLTDFLNVLDAERQEYALEDQFVSAQQAAADDFVALYKALGGGWQKYQTLPPIRRPMPAIIAAFERLTPTEPGATASGQ